jgi:hypothetical protein
MLLNCLQAGCESMGYHAVSKSMQTWPSLAFQQPAGSQLFQIELHFANADANVIDKMTTTCDIFWPCAFL